MTAAETLAPASGVTVVIPALNEEATIRDVVSAAQQIPADRVIVIDNGSIDATSEQARAAGAHVVPCAETGKSQAVRLGLETISARGLAPATVLLLDGDLTGLNVDHLRSLLAELDQPDVEMACAVLWRSRLHRTLRLPLPIATFSGQRALRHETLRSVQLEDCQGYNLEAVLSREIHPRQTKRVYWPGVRHTRREKRANTAWAASSSLPPRLAGPWMRIRVTLTYLGLAPAGSRVHGRRASGFTSDRTRSVSLLLPWLLTGSGRGHHRP